MSNICTLDISADMLSDWRSHLLNAEQDARISQHVPGCAACQVIIGQHERIAQSLRQLPTYPAGSAVWASLHTRIGRRPLPQRHHLGEYMRFGVVTTLVLIFALFFSFIARQSAGSTHPQISTPTPIRGTSTPTLSPTPPQTPFAGQPTYSNPLTADRQDGWSTSNDPNGSCRFASDGYHLLSPPSHGGFCANLRLYEANFALQVQMTFIQGSLSNEGGVNFRGVGAYGDASYQFGVNADGRYYLAWCATSNCSHVLVSGVAADFHQGLHQSNILGVSAQGSSLAIYLNHRLLQKVTDSHFAQGSIALTSGSNNDHTPNEVVYQDFQEWSL